VDTTFLLTAAPGGLRRGSSGSNGRLVHGSQPDAGCSPCHRAATAGYRIARRIAIRRGSSSRPGGLIFCNCLPVGRVKGVHRLQIGTGLGLFPPQPGKPTSDRVSRDAKSGPTLRMPQAAIGCCLIQDAELRLFASATVSAGNTFTRFKFHSWGPAGRDTRRSQRNGSRYSRKDHRATSPNGFPHQVARPPWSSA